MTTEEKIEQKMTVSIYSIDKSEFIDADFDSIVDTIMTEDKRYVEESLININNEKKIKIFYKFPQSSYEKWKQFFEKNLKEDNFLTYRDKDNFLQTKFTEYLSFLCFFQIKNELFVISAGKGYLLIDKWIDQYFGLDVITRLLKKNSPALKHLLDNSLSGSNFETSSFFRSNQSFLSQDDFGKIIREAIAELDEQQLQQIGIDTTERIHTKINCIAKSHFSPKTGVTLKELQNKILPNIEKLLSTKKANFKLNQVKKIKKQHPDYENLKKNLFETMYSNFLSFDFFPPKNTSDFFNASTYSILGEDIKIEDFDLTFIEKIESILDIQNLDFDSFQRKIESSYVRALDEEENPVSSSGFVLYRGIHGEFDYNDKHYFWLNGDFWQIEDSFIDDFNERAFSCFGRLQIRIWVFTVKED
jgi:uncharacterized protein (TIGR04141 family)